MIETTRNEKRLKGGFFTVYEGSSSYWIAENYHLYKSNEKHCRNSRDLIALYEDRKRFVNHAQIVDIDDCRYVVDFPSGLSQEARIRLIQAFHDGRTKTMRLDDLD